MKKILIPTLLTLATTPFISMVSCKQKDPEPEPEHDYSKDCLTITALEQCRCGFENRVEDPDVNYLPDLYYSVDGGEPKKYTFNPETLGDEIVLSQGSLVKFWGNNPDRFCSFTEGQKYIENFFTCTGKFNVSGNIMSLIDNGKCQQNQIPNDGCFTHIFGQTGLVDASNLVLPTGLTDYCFYEMFAIDKQLKKPPELKATTLAEGCYKNMFTNCHSLESFGELPATQLMYRCYDSMFYDCESLSIPPKILATKLGNYSCSKMFS